MQGHEGVASDTDWLGELGVGWNKWRGKRISSGAKPAGVRHVIKFSILGAAPESPSRLMRRHGEAEKML
jgi:hypothetical protein